MFQRRVKLRPLQRLREWLWPRSGWKRAGLYIWRRLWRLSGSPHTIALGVAVGVFVSCTPFLGLHVLLAMLVTWVLRGNVLAGIFGTMIGNPVTYPPVWFATYDLGNWFLGMRADNVDVTSTLMSERSFDMILPIIVPMAVGSVPVGLAAGSISYLLVKSAVAAYQHQRREMLEERMLTHTEMVPLDLPPDVETDDQQRTVS